MHMLLHVSLHLCICVLGEIIECESGKAGIFWGSLWLCQRAEQYVSTGHAPQCACQSMGRPKGEGQEAAPTNLAHPSS